MTTISEESDTIGSTIEANQLASDFQSESDSEIIYFNISDLSNIDSIQYHYRNQQLPSIELLLQTGPSSVGIDSSSYKSQWSKTNWTDCLFETSSKFCSTMESNSTSSPSTVSTIVPSIKQFKIHRSDNNNNDLYNDNGDFYYYVGDYDAYPDEPNDINNYVEHDNYGKLINFDRDARYDLDQSQLTSNRINKNRYHLCHHNVSKPYCFSDDLSKTNDLSNNSSAFLSSTTLITTTTLTTATRKGKSRLRSKKVWKKYSKKKNLSQDELERKRDLANEQERTRMHRLNTALKHLREAIPYEFSRHPPGKNLSKIKTLRIAIEYIRELTSILNVNQCLIDK